MSDDWASNTISDTHACTGFILSPMIKWSMGINSIEYKQRFSPPMGIKAPIQSTVMDKKSLTLKNTGKVDVYSSVLIEDCTYCLFFDHYPAAGEAFSAGFVSLGITLS
jgi:hypothetical protein